MRRLITSALFGAVNLNKQSSFMSHIDNNLLRGTNACTTEFISPVTHKVRTHTVLTGNERNGVMDAVHVSWTDLVGQEGLHNVRLSAGPLLAMADVCASHVAHKACAFAAMHQSSKSHAQTTIINSDSNSDNKEKGGNNKQSESSTLTQGFNKYLCCTVGVTNTVFHCPVLHGDSIRLDGRAVHCGNSSIGIHIRLFRRSPSTYTETFLGETFFTMVAITSDLKAAKVIPAMRLTEPFDVAMHNRYNKILELLKETNAELAYWATGTVTPEMVDCPINQSKSIHRCISSTQTIANRIFFSTYLNNNNTVFGGELMNWMERHAIYCARVFTNNKHVYTLGMHSVTFHEPLFANDWVSLEAYVIYVRNSTMEVEVRLRAEREMTGAVITNKASFIIIAFDDIGQKANIPCGIDLKSVTQEELRLYAEAKTRYYLRLERKDDLQSPLLREE